MILLGFLLFVTNCGIIFSQGGHFWHITDLHWDPDYKVTMNPNTVCPSSSKPVLNPGKWGSYLCDSNWDLINLTLHKMKTFHPKPDFILWTGDDTPHVADEKLGEDVVLRIISKLTKLIQVVFPGTKVYSAMGNHDFHPKNQLPGNYHKIYNRTAELWAPWMDHQSIAIFNQGAFYTEKLLGRTDQRIIVLNTNLYYSSNKYNVGINDPAGQFQWLEEILSNAMTAKEKVYIIGHVPPGFFEKKRWTSWFVEHFNNRYVEIIQKYHSVIAGQFFGHHHTDSFRMFYNHSGSPIGVMFITPGITPWKTTLPGVENGANNPAIRVFEYDTNTLEVQDVVTYFFNLSYANAIAPLWQLEYRLTEAFKVPDGTVKSMQTVLDKLYHENDYLQKYYKLNSVNYDLAKCDMNCRIDQICAIKEVDFAKYEECVKRESSSSALTAQVPIISFLLLSIVLLQF
ncbi:acid sphingomyelinase-like phosphodiesterase 3b isoform X2 [Chiloscyllium plagiosum]|uniref:acid sphingomyelinase-like phosphodiesterase 3b isoform X2 n=1 Tax=Chiloscyllium plagiosum TaxID=36176 RepID=UPI001CB7E71D|nr:acid sphingomyelinase-like phosphodiesterase 3b isoform X2 [Chiloscyllium plagiosum]